MRERQTATEIDKRHKELTETVSRGFDNLVEELKLGHTERYLEYLAFVSRFHRYSNFNQMLIFCQKPDATLVAGYRKWQELGYQVKRGEQGIGIIAPIFVKHREDDEYGRPTSIEKLVGFKEVKVFDASQLTEPVEDFWDFRVKIPENAESKYRLVERAVGSEMLEIVETPMKRGARGQATRGRIYLRQGMDSVDRTNVLIHEWAHEIMHIGPGRLKDEEWLPIEVRECQVESVAYIVSKYLGLESQFSRDYLLHYGNTPQTLIDHMESVQKTSQYMIRTIEETNK